MSDGKITVNLGDHTGQILVGEHDISDDVRSVSVYGRAGEHPVVVLELITAEAGPVVARLSEATRAALMNMGWTPPRLRRIARGRTPKVSDDRPFSVQLSAMLAEGLPYGVPPTGEEPVPDLTVRKVRGWMQVSCCLMTDSTGVNHCEHPPPPPPPPVPWSTRVRRRLSAWRLRTGQRIGSGLAGERLLTTDEAYDLRENDW